MRFDFLFSPVAIRRTPRGAGLITFSSGIPLTSHYFRTFTIFFSRKNFLKPHPGWTGRFPPPPPPLSQNGCISDSPLGRKVNWWTAVFIFSANRSSFPTLGEDEASCSDEGIGQIAFFPLGPDHVFFFCSRERLLHLGVAGVPLLTLPIRRCHTVTPPYFGSD